MKEPKTCPICGPEKGVAKWVDPLWDGKHEGLREIECEWCGFTATYDDWQALPRRTDPLEAAGVKELLKALWRALLWGVRR
jgi:RNA polymerase subunit RPABC4/transcription elongation factor Spt4